MSPGPARLVIVTSREAVLLPNGFYGSRVFGLPTPYPFVSRSLTRCPYRKALSLLAATSLSSVRADSVAFRKKVLATPGLIGYWPFEDSLIDLTANANDARVQGNAAAITFGPGINGGRALKIENPDAGGNFVDVLSPPGSIFDAPKFTVVTSAILTKT